MSPDRLQQEGAGEDQHDGLQQVREALHFGVVIAEGPQDVAGSSQDGSLEGRREAGLVAGGADGGSSRK